MHVLFDANTYFYAIYKMFTSMGWYGNIAITVQPLPETAMAAHFFGKIDMSLEDISCR